MAYLAATKKKDVKRLEQLIKSGGNGGKEDINEQDKKGFTALHFASQMGPPGEKMLKMLLSAGASPLIKNKQGKTPMMLTTHLPSATALKDAEATYGTGNVQALLEDMERLLAEGLGVDDVVVKLDSGKECKAHQCVLSLRCKSFAEMISKMAEKREASERKSEAYPQVELTLEGISDAEWQVLSMYIYTGKLGNIALSTPDLVPLLAHAHKFELARMASLVEAKIRREVTDKDVLPTFRVAHEKGEEKLKEYLLFYIVQNYASVIQQDISVVGSDLMAEIMRAQLNQDNLVEPEGVVVRDSHLRADMQRLLDDQKNCDHFAPVKDSSDSRGAHRAILACRSQYYCDLFAGKVKDPENTFPTIECLDSLLVFLYTNHTEVMPRDAMYLQPKIEQNFFGLTANDLLKNICVHSFAEKVSDDNLIDVYLAACIVDREDERRITISKIVNNFSTVAQQEKLEELSKPQLLEIMHAFGKDGQQVQAVIKTPLGGGHAHHGGHAHGGASAPSGGATSAPTQAQPRAAEPAPAAKPAEKPAAAAAPAAAEKPKDDDKKTKKDDKKSKKDDKKSKKDDKKGKKDKKDKKKK